MSPPKAVYSLSSKDQDKTRPLSTLANLAIIITDVQDMDPIFINLPYSTNIYEHSPPVRRSLALVGLPSELLLGTGGPLWLDRRFLGISYSPQSLCMSGLGVLAQ